MTGGPTFVHSVEFSGTGFTSTKVTDGRHDVLGGLSGGTRVIVGLGKTDLTVVGGPVVTAIGRFIMALRQ